jgi:hypothetical protein
MDVAVGEPSRMLPSNSAAINQQGIAIKIPMPRSICFVILNPHSFLLH